MFSVRTTFGPTVSIVNVSLLPSVEPSALVALAWIVYIPSGGWFVFGNVKLNDPLARLVVGPAITVPVPSSRETCTPGSVTPKKWGLATLVMLSPFTPESSAGSIVRFGTVSGPGALIVKFTTGLRLSPCLLDALAWTVNCPSMLVGLGNCKVNDPSGLPNMGPAITVPVPSSSSTVTPGSVTPMKCGCAMIVMLSPAIPLSSAGLIWSVRRSWASGARR